MTYADSCLLGPLCWDLYSVLKVYIAILQRREQSELCSDRWRASRTGNAVHMRGVYTDTC